jgi:hypothetical protein
MNELIKAIETLKKYHDLLHKIYADYAVYSKAENYNNMSLELALRANTVKHACGTAITCMEQQLKNRWISDDLPPEPSMEDEEPDEYIVTLNKYALVPTVLYYLGKGNWAREYDEPSQIYDSVLAWKKMPEIYKEESDAERS